MRPMDENVNLSFYAVGTHVDNQFDIISVTGTLMSRNIELISAVYRQGPTTDH
jgi:hypothetical protein